MVSQSLPQEEEERTHKFSWANSDFIPDTDTDTDTDKNKNKDKDKDT